MKRSMAARQARQRAAVILQVRAGQLTATVAARLLGLSRQAYYQWEQRALAAMLLALQERPRGRPRRQSDPQKEALQRHNQQLLRQLSLYEQKEKLRKLLTQPQGPTPGGSAKKKSRSPAAAA